MRNRIAAILIAFVMMFGFAQVVTAPVTSVASADTYTTARHVCKSGVPSIRLETKWGANLYYRDLARCTTGPSGANGGHVPTRYLVPKGWCGRNNLYNNGKFVDTLIVNPGWRPMVRNYANMIKIFRC